MTHDLQYQRPSGSTPLPTLKRMGGAEGELRMSSHRNPKEMQKVTANRKAAVAIQP